MKLISNISALHYNNTWATFCSHNQSNFLSKFCTELLRRANFPSWVCNSLVSMAKYRLLFWCTKIIGATKVCGKFMEISFGGKFLQKAMESQEICQTSFAFFTHFFMNKLWEFWDLAEDSKFYLISMNILISYVLGNLWTITGRSYMSVTYGSYKVKGIWIKIEKWS